MKVAVIGGVTSTEVLIRKLAAHGFDQVRVWGYVPADASLVSGWTDLAAVSAELSVEHIPFVKVASCEQALRDYAPDVVFAVGISQLLSPALLGIARLENIGFHPTALPKGRGRGAIAWLVLDGAPGAATFFGIREGIDDGPIYVQHKFEVGEDDDAAAVVAKVLKAEGDALDEWLPSLREGTLSPRPQDEAEATWYGRRAPEDGWIDWQQPAQKLLNLIRASCEPHPGAITFSGDVKLTIWEAQADERRETGVVGRILQVHGDGGFTVQVGDGLVRVTRWNPDTPWAPRVGVRLGYYAEAEIHQLRHRCDELERRLGALEPGSREEATKK